MVMKCTRDFENSTGTCYQKELKFFFVFEHVEVLPDEKHGSREIVAVLDTEMVKERLLVFTTLAQSAFPLCERFSGLSNKE